MKLLLNLMRLLSESDLNFILNLTKKALGEKLPHSTKNKQFWRRMSSISSLKKISVPSCPSAGDISIYDKYIKKVFETKPDSSILMLGTTPKIRGLLQNIGITNYIIADFSTRMMINNLNLSVNIDPEKEIWIKTDWTDLSSLLRPVNCVLGDLILNQFPPDEQSFFLEKISMLLDDGGFFIIRDHVINKKIINFTPEQIITESLKGILQENFRTVMATLFYRLRDKLRDAGKQTAIPTKIAKVLIAYRPDGELETRLLRSLLLEVLRRSRDNLEINAQTQEELESMITKFFHIEEKTLATDYEDAEYFPLYILKKKITTP
ncbi:hypothetical protein A2627_01760 [Candidatus Woesebacteria bacterium RIFCSPHIGHO2_01_FULL_39_28]|uniref:Methyltransferase type 11 domain-containing protein n=1 Tax=Candidatus Woesebacteria bacterium RIFCSPHIGHO2_01_FULL_39_28 TaxID=1802496 RepID=A0A1F7YL14_9BACT|nr:MAG: hypothetical protein A2627_01760 [Candidatus Woesebacteria bacterium RIFCSPHIGHO2_01_FULL_39_28]